MRSAAPARAAKSPDSVEDAEISWTFPGHSAKTTPTAVLARTGELQARSRGFPSVRTSIDEDRKCARCFAATVHGDGGNAEIILHGNFVQHLAGGGSEFQQK
jgi:hypothetical protein